MSKSPKFGERGVEVAVCSVICTLRRSLFRYDGRDCEVCVERVEVRRCLLSKIAVVDSEVIETDLTPT